MRPTSVMFIIFTIILLTACQTTPPNSHTPTPPDTPAPTLTPNLPPSTLFNIAWDDRTSFRAGLIDSEQAALDRLPGATVYHFDLTIAESMLALQGREEVHYTNTEDVALNEIYFRLYPNLFGGSITIDNLTVNAEALQPEYELAESALRVTLPQALPPGQSVVIGMGIAVEIPDDPSGNYGLFGYVDGVLALAHFYPMIPVYDDEGWNIEIPPQQGDVVYADSSFYLVRFRHRHRSTDKRRSANAHHRRRADARLLHRLQRRLCRR